MSKIKDGGQAFPTGNPTHGGHEGMTLRQWYAGQALAGSNWDKTGLDEKGVAELCFVIADAMLAEGAKEAKP